MDTGLSLGRSRKVMRRKRKNSGSSMVEVLVGFTILMILMAGLTAIIHVSSEMLFSTHDMLQTQSSYLQQFYKNEHGALSKTSTDAADITLIETDSEGESKKSGGTEFELDHARLEKVSDSESGLTVYQIDYR
jgi:hypothetical protein